MVWYENKKNALFKALKLVLSLKISHKHAVLKNKFKV